MKLLFALALALLPTSAIAQYSPQYELIMIDNTHYPPIRENVAGPFNSIGDCMSAETALGAPPQGYHYYCWML